MSAYERVINGQLIVERFGKWPSFHDAEVVRLVLDRHGANGHTAPSKPPHQNAHGARLGARDQWLSSVRGRIRFSAL